MSGPNGTTAAPTGRPDATTAVRPENLGGSAPGSGRSVHDNPLLAKRREASGDTSHNSAAIHNRLQAIMEPSETGVDDGASRVPEESLAGLPTAPGPDDPAVSALTPELPDALAGEEHEQQVSPGEGFQTFTVTDLAGALEMPPEEVYQRFGLTLRGTGPNGESQFVPLSKLKDAAQMLVQTGGNLEDLNVAIEQSQTQPAELQAAHAQIEAARHEVEQNQQTAVAIHRQAQERMTLADSLVQQLRDAFVPPSLEQEDPGAWAAQNYKWEQFVGQVQQAHQRATQEARQLAATELQKAQVKGWQQLLAKPDFAHWRQDETRGTEQKAIRSFLSARYGFSAQEMNRLADARLMHLAFDAWKANSDRESVDLNKLRNLNPVVTLKPGAQMRANVQASGETHDRHEKLVNAHHENPRSRSALRSRLASYIEDRQEVPIDERSR